jgi:type IV secretion system protein TrbG
VIIVVATFTCLQRWRQDDIQMPASMSQSEAPILLVVRKNGGLFTDEESVQVTTGCKAIAISLTVFLTRPSLSRVGFSQDRVTNQKGE